MDIQKLNSWEEFKDVLEVIKEEYARDHPSYLPLLYRGQESSEWSLCTTLERIREGMSFKEYYRVISRIKPQVESFTNQEWSIPNYPEMHQLSNNYEAFYNHLLTGRRTEYPYMAYLRHHGFPSPLLDWTRSAFVAAFFAFHKADERSTDYVSVFACMTELPNKLHGTDMSLVFRYGPYVKTDRRHFLQQSEYTLCVRFKDEWKFEPYSAVFESGHRQQGRCWKFEIPVKERRRVLIELNEFNLNAWSLFGSEESMMETLGARELYLEPKDSVRPTPSPKSNSGSFRVGNARSPQP